MHWVHSTYQEVSFSQQRGREPTEVKRLGLICWDDISIPRHGRSANNSGDQHGGFTKSGSKMVVCTIWKAVARITGDLEPETKRLPDWGTRHLSRRKMNPIPDRPLQNRSPQRNRFCTFHPGFLRMFSHGYHPSDCGAKVSEGW